MGGRGIDSTGVPREHPVPAYRFEWDPRKSASNKIKHGVDFTEAEQLFSDPFRASSHSTQPGAELREITVGSINGKLYTAIWTWRSGKRRIISVRRAHPKEETRYGRQENQHHGRRT